MKRFAFLSALILFIVLPNIQFAKDKNTPSNYSYDPYYENGHTKKHNYGKYRIRERSEDSPNFSLDAWTGLYTSYLWRNVVKNNDPVNELGFALMASDYTFKINTLTDLTNYGVGVGYGDQSFEFTEIDISLLYENHWNDLLYSIELKHYLFPNKFTPILATGRFSNESTSELNFLFGYNVVASPSLLISYDLDEIGGLYIEIGVSHSISLEMLGYKTRANFSGALSIGSAEFNKYNYGVDSFAPSGLSIIANWEWMMNSFWIVKPEIGVSVPIDADITDAIEANTNVQSSAVTFYFAVKMMVTF
ncbi:MAG: hypothetical protein COA79_01135 [Planctomycetota bacterium]|nr:MAG: hypothetical protein COA79_01135 [Planctomycetota bacterium]